MCLLFHKIVKSLSMWLTHLPMSIYILEKLEGGFTEPRKKKKRPHDGKVETRKQI